MKIFNDHTDPGNDTPDQNLAVIPGPLPLSAIRSGSTVRVEKLPDCKRASSSLLSLGLIPGTKLKVVQNLFGPIILEVRGSRLSLGHNLASRLLVKACGGSGRREGRNG